MKITFLGAAHQVTGSHTLVEWSDNRYFLVDYGMEQGENDLEMAELPVSPSIIEYVFLTHAHIDHSGLLPLLYKQGFRGRIYATAETTALCSIMLADSAQIQETDAASETKKNLRTGGPEVIPLYTVEDAAKTMEFFNPCEYNKIYMIDEGLSIRFIDAGHLLGSSFIEFFLEDQGKTVQLVCSGDVGNINQPIIKDPQAVTEADYLLIESTYGNRLHDTVKEPIPILIDVLKKTFERKGSVIIPSFAVGRTQELLYFFREIKQNHLMPPDMEGFKVYVDSPLANEATTIFSEHVYDCYDEEAMALYEKGINPIAFPGLRNSITSDDSKAINFDDEPKVIISASGMCDAGRIKHHLKHNLWYEDATILFVGYQATGTLGRSLIEGAQEVKLFGEPVHVAAHIVQMPGISGHADVNGLLDWISAFTEKPQRVFVTHGEDSVAELFAGRLRDEKGLNASAPYSGTVYDLASNECVYEAAGIRLEKKTGQTPKSQKAAMVYQKLVAAGQRLMSVIRKNEGTPNKELDRFAREVQSLCDRWDRKE